MLGIAFLELVKKLKKTIILSLLIGVVMFVGVLLVSTYLLQSAPYRPYKKIFDKNSHLVSLENVIIPENDDGYPSFVSGIIKLKAIDYPIFIEMAMNGSNAYNEVYGYDKCQAEYIPRLEEGEWFTKVSKKGCISTVVTHDTKNVKVGDIVEATTRTGDSCKLYICGRLAKGARIFDVLGASVDPSIFDIYEIDEKKTYIRYLVSKDDIVDMEDGYAPGCNVAISYESDITEEELKLNIEYYNRYGLNFIDDATDVCERTEGIIVRKLMNILPVGVAAFVFITVAIICIIALDTMAEIKDETIMYICGISGLQYAVITAIKGIVMSLIGYSAMMLFAKNLASKLLGELLVFEMEMPQIVLCVGVMVFYIAVMLIVRAMILRNNSIISVLRKADI